MASRSAEWFPFAQLLRPQGRKGELLADPQTDLEIFAPGQEVWLSPSEGIDPLPDARRVLESCWAPTGRNAGRLVLKLGGVDSISEAQALAGQHLLLPAASVPALAEDTFFTRDLIGCVLVDGERVAGTVVDVQFPVGPDGRTRLPDAPDLLAVQPVTNAPFPAESPSPEGSEPEPILVPFVRAWLTGVDLSARRITMQLPAGLFEGTD